MCPWKLPFPTPVNAPCSEPSRHNDPGRVATAVTVCHCHRGPGFTLGHTEHQPSAQSPLQPQGLPSLHARSCQESRWGTAGWAYLCQHLSYLPPPTTTTSQLTWDSQSELRGTRANGFRELENSGQEQLSTAIRQVVISPLHTGHKILADTDTTRGNRQTSFRHTPSGDGGHRARQHAKHFAQTGLFFSSHPVEGAYSYFPTLQIKNRALQTSRGFQDLKSAPLSPGWKLLLWVLQLCIS